MSEQVNNDLVALDRILSRLTGTSNENLPSVLISLIPKLIPLGNNEALRKKVIEISTEIIRRVKLGSIKLPLRIFAEIIHARHLPFAPTIGIGLMDAIHSANCICEVDETSAKSVVESILSHQHFTFLSNTSVYYLLHYSDKLAPVLLTFSDDERRHAEEIIGDYFIDILLLRDLSLDETSVGSISAGLSDKRRQRLVTKKRFLDAIGLHQSKARVMTYFTQICLDSLHPYLSFCAGIVGKCDADSAVSLKGIYLLNLINDKGRIVWKDDYDTSSLIINFIFHNRGLQSSSLVSYERTGLSVDILISALREMLRNWVVISDKPPHHLLVNLLKAYSKQNLDRMASESMERLTVLFLELLCVDEDMFSTQQSKRSSSNEELFPLLVESIWALLLRFASTGPTNSGSISEFRFQTYKLLAIMVKYNIPGVNDDPNLLVELLKLADFDEQSAGTPLHKVLQELREGESFQLDIKHQHMVAEQLDILRGSQRASSRLLYLQWTKRIFGVTGNFLTSLIAFCDDSNEMIAGYVERQFLDLEEFICLQESSQDYISTLFHDTVSLRQIIESAVFAITTLDTTKKQPFSLPRGAQRIIRVCALALLQQERHLHENKSSIIMSDGLVTLKLRFMFQQSFSHIHGADSILPWLTTILQQHRFAERNKQMFSNGSISMILNGDTLTLRDGWNRGSYTSELIDTLSIIGFAAMTQVTASSNLNSDNIKTIETLVSLVLSIEDRTFQLLGVYGMVQLLETSVGDADQNQFELTAQLVNMKNKLRMGHDFSKDKENMSTFELLSVIMSLALDSADASSLDWLSIYRRLLECLQHTKDIISNENSENVKEIQIQSQSELNILQMLCIVSDISDVAGISVEDQLFTFAHEMEGIHHQLFGLKLQVHHLFANNNSSDITVLPSLLTLFHKIPQYENAESLQDIRIPMVLAETLLLHAFRRHAQKHDSYDIYGKLIHELAVDVLGAEETQVKDEKRVYELKLIVSILLVFNKNLTYLFPENVMISFPTVDQALSLLLEILRESSGLLSDLCTMALNHLHRACESLSFDRFVNLGPGMMKFKNVGDYIAQECLATITRRKRRAQPIGFDASSRGTRATTTGTAQDSRGGGPQAIPVVLPTDTTSADGLRDALLDAASRMATEQFNVAMDGVTGSSANSSNLAEAIDTTENGYGAYQKLCQIARRSGDSAVVMMVLAQIRQDITLGEGVSAAMYAEYRSTTTPMTLSRILALVPALYMAKFDPIASIRDIMVRIWKDVVQQCKKDFSTEIDLINNCQHTILTYLTSQMLNPMWREREAAALALESIMVNRKWSVIEPHCSELLSKCFKLVDDLRESTRKAAIRTFKSLITHILRACDANESGIEVARHTMDLVLPILLTQGILSPALEARGFSFGLLLKMIDQASHEVLQSTGGSGKDGKGVTGKALEPWLDRLIDALVESISALEPQMMSYLQFHSSSLMSSSTSTASSSTATANSSGANNAMSRLQAQEEFERLRIELAQHSPMHEALQKCLRLVQYDLLPKVANTLFQHLRSGVGLPSRVAAADSVSFLAEQFPGLLGGTIGPQIMTLLGNLLSEKPHMEMTLKKALYNAYGVLSKVVPEAALEVEVERLISRYQELTALTAPAATAMVEYTGALRDKDLEAAMVMCMKYLLKRSGDRLSKDSARMNSLWVPLISMALLGTYDVSGEVSDTAATSTKSGPPAHNMAQEWQEILSLLVDISGLGSRLAATQRAKNTLVSYATLFLLDLSWERRQQGLQLLLKDVFGQSLSNYNHSTLEDETLDRLMVLFGALLVQVTYSGKQLCWQGQHLAIELLPILLSRVYPAVSFTDNEDENVFVLFSSVPGHVCLSITASTLAQHKAETMKLLQQQCRDLCRTQHRVVADEEVLLRTDAASSSAPTVRGRGSVVNVSRLLHLLLQQATRFPGGRDHETHETYRITVAKALHALPWTQLMSTVSSAEDVSQLVATLIRFAGFAIDDTVSLSDTGGDTGSAPSPSPVSQTGFVSATPTNLKTVSSQNNSSNFNNSNKKFNVSSAMMFGHRYGAAAVETRPKKMARLTVSSSGDTTPVSPASPLPLSTSAPPSSIAVATHATPPVSSIKLLKPPSVSPVFRMYSLQALASVYLAVHATRDTRDTETCLATVAVSLLPIVSQQFQFEVWTVKAAVLTWLAAVVQTVSVGDEERDTVLFLEQLCRVVSLAVDEPKYVQVKLRALEVFAKGLEGVNREVFRRVSSVSSDGDTGDTSKTSLSLVERFVRPALRKLATDTTAEVLEAVANLQQKL